VVCAKFKKKKTLEKIVAAINGHGSTSFVYKVLIQDVYSTILTCNWH